MPSESTAHNMLVTAGLQRSCGKKLQEGIQLMVDVIATYRILFSSGILQTTNPASR